MMYDISVKDVVPQQTASIRVCIKPEKISAVLGEILPEVWNYLELSGISPTGPPYSRYYEQDSDLVDLEAGFPVPDLVKGKGQIVAGELPGGKVAYTWHVGPYNWLSMAYDALSAWMKNQGREPAGPPWEVYWTDPGEVTDPAEWKTEVLWPFV